MIMAFGCVTSDLSFSIHSQYRWESSRIVVFVVNTALILQSHVDGVVLCCILCLMTLQWIFGNLRLCPWCNAIGIAQLLRWFFCIYRVQSLPWYDLFQQSNGWSSMQICMFTHSLYVNCRSRTQFGVPLGPEAQIKRNAKMLRHQEEGIYGLRRK